jgi:hypothetical protein
MNTLPPELVKALAALEGFVSREEMLETIQGFFEVVNKLSADNKAEFRGIYQAVKDFSDKLRNSNEKHFDSLRTNLTNDLAAAIALANAKAATLKDGRDGYDGVDGEKGEKGDKGDKGDPGKDAELPEEIFAKLDRFQKELDAKPRGSGVFGWGAHPLTISNNGAVVDKNARHISFKGSGVSSVTRNANGIIEVTLSGGSSGEVPLTFENGLTRTTNTITNDLITGKAGGQMIIGGTGQGDGLIYKGTTFTPGATSSAAAHTFLSGSNGVTTAMVILNSGNVGIGATPLSKFWVSAAASLQPTFNITDTTSFVQFRFAENDVAVARVQYIASAFATVNRRNALELVSTNGPINFLLNSTERMRLDSTGLGIFTDVQNSRLHVNGSFAMAYRALTAARTLDISDHTINCTANTFNVTLPTAVGITGRQYVVKNTGAGTITVATTSTQTIDGAATVTLTTNQSVRVVSNGANWIIT